MNTKISEPVGIVGSMPGTDGFTMACFKATDVPVGTALYLHPQPAELAEPSGNSGELPPPDEKLLRFYDVSTYPQLVAALEEHVMKLLDLRKRNVKPWEDTFPPTLLPKYERDQHPVFAKDLLALADKWQDAAAETWGEGPVNSTKQDCCDELRDVVSASIYARAALAATGKQQVGEVQGDARRILAKHMRRIAAAYNVPRLGTEADIVEGGEEYDFWMDAALAAVSEALATRQPGAQVPVAFVSSEMLSSLLKVRSHNWMPEVWALPNGTDSAPLYAAPPAPGIDLGPGVRAIADERQRQVDAEGYSAESDAEYRAGELANAALAYAQVAAMDLAAGGRSHVATRSPPACWPWHRLWWKPKDARRDLVRAGALIAAQIDLIDSQRDAAPGVGNG